MENIKNKAIQFKFLIELKETILEKKIQKNPVVKNFFKKERISISNMNIKKKKIKMQVQIKR